MPAPSQPQTDSPTPVAPLVGTDAFCRRCDYNLRGLSGDPVRCPECSQMNARLRAVIETDALCRRCDYNLRGLSGDPVRCPECGQMNSLADLLDLVTPARRIRALQGAGDALVLAAFSLAGGLAGVFTSRSPVISIVLLILGGVLVQQALRTCRRMIPLSVDWPNLFTTYFLYTIALPVLPCVVWWLSAVLTWRGRIWIGNLTDNHSVDFVDFVTAVPIVGAILFIARPIRRIRWKQRRAFARLIRAIRVASAESQL